MRKTVVSRMNNCPDSTIAAGAWYKYYHAHEVFILYLFHAMFVSASTFLIILAGDLTAIEGV
jgi:hypothetical protein